MGIYVLLILAAFAAALLSGAAGFGGSLLLLPVVTACLGAEAAVPVLTLAQLMGNLARMASGWREIQWKSVGWFCLTALPLAALGAFGFTVLPKDLVTRCIGGALILLALLQRFKIFRLKGNRRTLLAGGAVTGALSGLAGSGGPIGAAVFLSLNLAPVAYIASEAATATAMHLLKTVLYAKLTHVTLQAFGTGVLMGLAMVAGTFLAKRLIRNMERGRFQKFVMVLLCLAGGYLLLFGA